MLGVSRWTTHRPVGEYSLQDMKGFDDLPDEGVDWINWIIQDYINKRGNVSGCNVIASNLKSIGLWIQSQRVRERLAKLDPENNALRWGATIQHRKYQVPSLNSLWHLDGHHSLIRWKPVIHGCIDGFSRRIIFLLCCPNNRYKTVLGLFLNAVERYRPMAIES